MIEIKLIAERSSTQRSYTSVFHILVLTLDAYLAKQSHLKYVHKMAACIAVTSHIIGSQNSSGKAHPNVDVEAYMDSARLSDVTFPNNSSRKRTSNPGEPSPLGEVLKTASPKTLPYGSTGMILGSTSRLHTRSVSLNYGVSPAVHIRNQRAQPRHRLEPRKKQKGTA